MSNLHIDSIIKSFGQKQVLTDIFLTCSTGEIIGLLGRNGTGKSTLLKIIFGSLLSDTKFIKVNGKIIRVLYDNRDLIKYLPQDSFLPNHAKVNKIISVFCKGESAEIIKDHKLIKPLLDKKSNQISGGERRLLEIFLISYSPSEFVLIDEPFNGISPLFKEDIKGMLKEQSKFKGFIITDHDYRNILEIATRIVLLHDGGIKQICHKDELKCWGYIPEIA